ncbi:MAG: TIGR03905 family TSCPD domain-containing protein [Eubacteriaceae bacterium]|nr:TIGR03905 family TSCPD domain-containing protein [Eubacteriaceae bacterium]
MRFSYKTTGTCSTQIDFDYEDGKISGIRFTGGCPGNLKAISKLLEGADAKYVVDTLTGNLCGTRGTSCADQLAKAVKAAMEKQA